MISRLRGTLLQRGPELVEIATPGGVVYEVSVPLTVLERLPAVGEEVELRTVHLLREDHAALFGFADERERTLFQRLLTAPGVGARVALAMLSTYSAPRLARLISDKDVGALVQISGIGKKTAEKLVLEISDKVGDLASEDGVPAGAGTVGGAAVQALMALGMSFQEADAAVRAVLDEEEISETHELVRRALAGR